MLRGGDPVAYDLARIPRSSCRRAWPSMISTIAFSPPASAPFTSPLSNEANGSLVFHSGCCGASAFTRSSAKSELKIHRLLAPERAVVVERGDAFRRREQSPANLPSSLFRRRQRWLSSARCRSRTEAAPGLGVSEAGEDNREQANVLRMVHSWGSGMGLTADYADNAGGEEAEE